MSTTETHIGGRATPEFMASEAKKADEYVEAKEEQTQK